MCNIRRMLRKIYECMVSINFSSYFFAMPGVSFLELAFYTLRTIYFKRSKIVTLNSLKFLNSS